MKKNWSLKYPEVVGDFPTDFISLPLFLIPLPEVLHKLPIEKTDKYTAYFQDTRPRKVSEEVENTIISIDHFQSNTVAPQIDPEVTEIRLQRVQTKKKKKDWKDLKKIPGLLISRTRGFGKNNGVEIIRKKPVEKEIESKTRLNDIFKVIRKIENFDEDEGNYDEGKNEPSEPSESSEEEEGEDDGDIDLSALENRSGDTKFSPSEWGVEKAGNLYMQDVTSQVARSLRRKVEGLLRNQKSNRNHSRVNLGVRKYRRNKSKNSKKELPQKNIIDRSTSKKNGRK